MNKLTWYLGAGTGGGGGGGAVCAVGGVSGFAAEVAAGLESAACLPPPDLLVQPLHPARFL